MAVELHLPDLPEVPISIGPPPRGRGPRPRTPWHLRLRDALSSYLPLLLMALLALATWWLVKNTPLGPGQVEVPPPRRDPDYTMTDFALERFAPDGRMKVRIEGARLRHFPDVDRIEADQVRLRAVALDGSVTLASATRAVTNGDASEVQLIGNARVTSDNGRGQAPVEMASEFIHVFLVTERITTPLPVDVRRGATHVNAGGLEYDHGAGRLDLMGPVRAVFPPAARPAR